MPPQAKAVEACRATLTRAFALSQSAVSTDETTAQFLDTISSAGIISARSVSAPMRVVLMGRTMAGKSTLLAALTGGSVERIGVGAQRTSHDVFAAPAIDLPGIEIVDTPGVGAKDGADDVAIAMAEVSDADLVLWVASNDSFQEETAQALRAVAFRGKPVVVALNCRAPLADDLDREDFLEDRSSVFDQYEGHFATIRSHLSAAAVRPIAEVMLHAEAARLARVGGVDAVELREASRLGDLLVVLEKESRDRRKARRVLREADEVRSQAQLLIEVLVDVEQETREIVEIGRGMREDQERRVARVVNACKQRLEDDVIRLVGQRQGWHQVVTDFGPRVAEDWDMEQAALVADLDEATGVRLADLARTIAETSVAAEREWATAVRPHSKLEGLRDFRGLWKRKAAGIVVGGGGALAAAGLGFMVGGPVGSVVGVAGSLLVPALRKKVQSLFTSKAKVMEQNRELLRTEIAKILSDLQDRTLAELTGAIAHVREELAVAYADREKGESDALAVAELLAQQHEVVLAAISALDRETVRCLLRADGRPRLAESVEKATRLPGVCIAVEVPGEALAEAWLFPPSSPEIQTFGRIPPPELPGAHAVSYVLGLTEEVPASIRCRPDSTIVTTTVRAPNSTLEAWSATLSDHLGTAVQIVRPSTPRSTTT